MHIIVTTSRLNLVRWNGQAIVVVMVFAEMRESGTQSGGKLAIGTRESADGTSEWSVTILLYIRIAMVRPWHGRDQVLMGESLGSGSGSRRYAVVDAGLPVALAIRVSGCVLLLMVSSRPESIRRSRCDRILGIVEKMFTTL